MGNVITNKEGTSFVDIVEGLDGKKRLACDTELTVSEIQIGAVEIKDATTTARATVSDGRLHVIDDVLNSLIPSAYDYIEASYPDAVTEIYIFKTGGSGGTTVSTLTLVYTDSTKENFSSLTKS